jgi:Kef-type K+ transport system membrane component KefB
MFEDFYSLVRNISLPHLNILLLIGLALFGGTVGGRIFQKLKIPQVVGYISIGIVIGESGLKIIGHSIVASLQPFSYFALGLIGFMIGGELKKGVLLKYGKQFITILLFEGMGAFLAVTLLVGTIGTLLFKDWRMSWSLAILLGAIGSATAPAATVQVLREYKTRGPLTRPLYEIIVAIVLGIFCGALLNKLLNKYPEKERHLVFTIGIVLLVSGIALAIHVDLLLAVMTLGIIITNSTSKKGKDIFKLLEGFSPPIYVLFFVLVGAKLNISYITLPTLFIICLYLVGVGAGKMFGTALGARLSQAANSVRRYLPLCLFSQAGVAIGLSILASNYFPGNIGNTVVAIITAAIFVLEIIGPPLVKLGVTKAGEVGLDITEEDLLSKTRVNEMMDKNPPFLYEITPLDGILELFSNTGNLYYPVVNNEKKLTGIISVDTIRNTLRETELKGLVLAADLQEPVRISVSGEIFLAEATTILDKNNLEYLAVVTKEARLEGFLERRILEKLVATKIIELQKQTDALEKAG